MQKNSWSLGAFRSGRGWSFMRSVIDCPYCGSPSESFGVDGSGSVYLCTNRRCSRGVNKSELLLIESRKKVYCRHRWKDNLFTSYRFCAVCGAKQGTGL